MPRLVREAQSCSHLQVGIAQVTQVCAVFRLEYVEKHAKETGEQNAGAQDGEVIRHIVSPSTGFDKLRVSLLVWLS